MAVNGIALAAVGGGVIFAYGGIKGKSPLQTLQAVLQGTPPGQVSASQAIAIAASSPSLGTEPGDGGGPIGAAGSGAAQVNNFLVAKGVPKHQRAGALGNMDVETGGTFSPSIVNQAEGAIGYCQWELGRREKLKAYAAAHGGSEADGLTQLNFMWHELHTSEFAAYTLWRASPDVTTAATAWQSAYERSAPGSLGERIARAKKWEGRI